MIFIFEEILWTKLRIDSCAKWQYLGHNYDFFTLIISLSRYDFFLRVIESIGITLGDGVGDLDRDLERGDRLRDRDPPDRERLPRNFDS